MDPHLKHPFTGIVAKPTACGKSTRVKNLITYQKVMINPVPEHVIWFYGEWQPLYNLFTKGSHHSNLSVLHLVQNVFDKNKHTRTISLNAHYLVIFKNPRDASQVTHSARSCPIFTRSVCRYYFRSLWILVY